MFSGSLQPLTADRGSEPRRQPRHPARGLPAGQRGLRDRHHQDPGNHPDEADHPDSPGAGLHRGADQPAGLGDPDREPEEAVWPARLANSTTRPARSWSTSTTRRWDASSTRSPRSCGSTATRSSRRRWGCWRSITSTWPAWPSSRSPADHPRHRQALRGRRAGRARRLGHRGLGLTAEARLRPVS